MLVNQDQPQQQQIGCNKSKVALIVLVGIMTYFTLSTNRVSQMPDELITCRSLEPLEDFIDYIGLNNRRSSFNCGAYYFLQIMNAKQFRGRFGQNGQTTFQITKSDNFNKISLQGSFQVSKYVDDYHQEFSFTTSFSSFAQGMKQGQIKLLTPIKFNKDNLLTTTNQTVCPSTFHMEITNQTQNKSINALILNIQIESSCLEDSLIGVGLQNFTGQLEYRAIVYSFYNTIITIIIMMSCIKIFRSLLIDFEETHEDYSKIMIAMFMIQDALIAGLNFLIALKSDIYFQYFITPSFLYLILFGVFEIRLLFVLWKSSQAQNIPNPRKQLHFYCLVYSSIFFFGFLIIMLINYNLTLILLSMYLVPQIIHQAERGQHVKFNFKLILGFTIPRLFQFIYFRAVDDNVLDLKPKYLLISVIIVIFVLQVVCMYLQHRLGPQFFIPAFILPKKYNYFVEIPDSFDLEMGPPNEFQVMYNIKQFLFQEECQVCMNQLHLTPSLSLTQEEQRNFMIQTIMRRQTDSIMKTPCDHRFHVLCLAKWMAIKLTCPSCRAALPPI